MTTTKNIIISVLMLAACGSGQKRVAETGLGGNKAPPPPTAFGGEVKSEAAEPKRELSKDAKSDFQDAVDYYTQQDKAGWNESSCKTAADKFDSVANEHKLVEARYMVGRSYHNCNMKGDAERAYQAALAMKSNYGAAMSALGELYYEDGKVDAAKDYWQNAIKANPKLVGARNDIASLDLEEMRKVGPNDPHWKDLEADARNNLSSVLAVDNDNVKAYVLYGLVYLEGRQKNKNRLDLAKLLLDEGAKRNEKYAPLENARGLYFLFRNNLTEALQHFGKAVELDPNFAEARMNVGLITLGFRKYDVAKDQFQHVLDLKSKDDEFDATIGLGIAQRGLGDLDGAEASYKQAMKVDSKRGESFYNLGVLYKDFRAAKQSDLKASQQAYMTARDYFKQFLDKTGSDADKAEAKDNIADCDKVIKQLDDFMKNMANQPPPPPPAPAGSGSGAGSAGGSGAGSGSGSGADAPKTP
ncbi:MAG TPA: tetratricopeptide repeat protein [Kofleriaceae bacterium]|nr:tetratricopeptide repeat protein [Kofleriaceae bacterium]